MGKLTDDSGSDASSLNVTDGLFKELGEFLKKAMDRNMGLAGRRCKSTKDTTRAGGFVDKCKRPPPIIVNNPVDQQRALLGITDLGDTKRCFEDCCESQRLKFLCQAYLSMGKKYPFFVQISVVAVGGD